MEGLEAVIYWATRQVRLRRRSLVVLGVLAGLTASLTMAAAAGARRTSTALVRLETTTRASDAIVFTSQVQDIHPAWKRLERRPEVAALAVWDLLFGSVGGQPGAVLFASNDGRWGTVIDKPVVLQGRMWNPRADEIVIDQQLAEGDHLGVGAVIPFHAFAPDQPDKIGQPTGPTILLHVVGIVRDTEEFLFTPGGIVSPAVLQHYGSRIFVLPNAMVRLRAGGGGIAALRRDATALIAPNVPVLSLQSAARRITTTLHVESFALWLLALAVVLAGGLLVLQMLTRSISIIMGDDIRTLRALGLTRRDIVAASVATHAIVIACAATIGGVVAFALSPLFPVGLGRQVDPDPGLHADWMVIGIGLLATVLVLLLAISGVTLTILWRGGRPSIARSSSFMNALRRVAPPPVSLGISAAFGRGRAARGTPVRPALIGAIVGVLGVVGALTLDHGIHNALDNPQLAGVTWAAEVSPLPEDETATSISPTLLGQVQLAAPDASTAVVRRDLVDVDGVGVPTVSVLDVSKRAGPIGLTVVAGRAPRTPREGAIGPNTAQLLHVRVGDWVRIAHGVRVHLVGEALFPSDVHSEFDEGLWLIPAEFDAVVPPNRPSSPDEVVAVRYPAAGGAEASALRAAEVSQAERNPPPSPINHLVASLGGPNSLLGQGVQPASVPLELTNLSDVAQLPTILSVFLALLAVAALSFVLITSSRSRRMEVAVLRAIGLSARASGVIVHWQATAIAFVGLLIGIPLGIVVGRWTWYQVTVRVPLLYVSPLALVVVGLAVPAALLLANLVATVPARGMHSVRLAEVLRAE
jgi:ABC-type lipoprotein release transport system permease subunit